MKWLTGVWDWLCAWAAGLTEWHFVNLIVPTALPIVVATVVWISTTKKEANPWSAVKDGQLGWAALCMCCSALMELRHPSSGVVLQKSWENAFYWIVGLGIFLTGLTAGIAPLTPTPAKRPKGLWASVVHFRLFLISLGTTFYCAWLYTTVHLTTQRS